MDALVSLPTFWAQAVPGTDPDAIPLLALRRWFTSQTLSSPSAVPTLTALWIWLGGLLALLVLAILVQGPRRALGQLLDIPGHVRLLGAAVLRCRRAGRVVAVLLGVAVLAWSFSQFRHFREPQRLNDLLVLKKSRSLVELSFEQGVLTALTPLRDLCALGDWLLLLVTATILVFKLSADRWGNLDSLDEPAPLPPWTTLCWGCGWLYAMYRIGNLVIETGGLPLGGCLIVEAVVVPVLMALADGLLLGWVVVELRNAGLGDAGAEQLDVREPVALWPAATLACLLALPARYVATGAWLLLPYVGQSAMSLILPLVRGWGLVLLQGSALLTVGLTGALAWSGGGLGGLIGAYGRLLRDEGGRLVAVLLVAGLAAGGLSGLAYALVLSQPALPWVLEAADSYAHYASLPIGLATLAALVELTGRALPVAAVAAKPDEVPDEVAVV